MERNYPRHQVVKRPWKPEPGKHYLSIASLASLAEGRDWVVLYVRGENSKPHEQTRHATRDEAWEAYLTNVKYLREYLGIDIPKVFPELFYKSASQPVVKNCPVCFSTEVCRIPGVIGIGCALCGWTEDEPTECFHKGRKHCQVEIYVDGAGFSRGMCKECSTVRCDLPTEEGPLP